MMEINPKNECLSCRVYCYPKGSYDVSKINGIILCSRCQLSKKFDKSINDQKYSMDVIEPVDNSGYVIRCRNYEKRFLILANHLAVSPNNKNKLYTLLDCLHYKNIQIVENNKKVGSKIKYDEIRLNEQCIYCHLNTDPRDDYSNIEGIVVCVNCLDRGGGTPKDKIKYSMDVIKTKENSGYIINCTYENKNYCLIANHIRVNYDNYHTLYSFLEKVGYENIRIFESKYNINVMRDDIENIKITMSNLEKEVMNLKEIMNDMMNIFKCSSQTSN